MGAWGNYSDPSLPRQGSNLGLPDQSRASCRWTTGHRPPEGSALRNKVRERLRGVGRNEVADSGELFEMLLVVKFGADHVGPSFLLF